MGAKLFCRTGELAGTNHLIGAEATIGRSAENTLVLGASVISQIHARIFFDAAVGGYILEDLQSKNGTQLDGISVHGRERLRDLHVVTLGEVHDFIFVVLPAPADASAPVDVSGNDAHEVKGHIHSAPPDPASETIPHAASVLEMPVLTDVEAAAEARPPGGQTVYGPPSVVAVPSFEEAPGSLDSKAVSGSETVHELPAALAVPSFEGTPGPLDSEAVSESETVHEPLSELRLPQFGEDQAGGEAPRRPEPIPDPVARRAVLEVTLSDHSSFRIDLAEGVNAVGRAPECQVHIDDRTLSRRHGVLTVEGDTVTFEDHSSRNGTFKDGVRLTGPVRLRVGEVLTFGDHVTARLLAP